MKTITKTRLRSAALAVLALLLTSASYAQGQELIRNIPELDDYSIIRQIDPNNWLVYAYGEGNKFYWVSDTNTSAPFKGLLEKNLKINDFEIFEDMVYFCGSVLDETPYAVMGYFPLSGFPSGPLYLDTVQRMVSFDKLDVFSVLEQIHLVMTGRDSNGVGAMIDVMASAPQQWLYTIAYPEDGKFIFDDVAVTDNLVVYTSRDILSQDKYGDDYLWYYNKPTGVGVTIFLYPSGNYHFINDPESPVLIEHMYDDWFAIACNSQRYYISTSLFDGINYDATFRYYATEQNSTVLDIKYNPDDQEIDIIEATWMEESGMLWSVCTHIEQSFFTATSSSTIYMNYPSEKTVLSIDYLPGMPSYYIASGFDRESLQLFVYRYKYNAWGDCSEIFEFWGETVDIGNEPLTINYEQKPFVHEIKESSTSQGTLIIYTECESEVIE